jgi:hypothetical protein
VGGVGRTLQRRVEKLSFAWHTRGVVGETHPGDNVTQHKQGTGVGNDAWIVIIIIIIIKIIIIIII